MDNVPLWDGWDLFLKFKLHLILGLDDESFSKENVVQESIYTQHWFDFSITTKFGQPRR